MLSKHDAKESMMQLQNEAQKATESNVALNLSNQF